MIAIIDYGMGNLRSVQKAFEKIGREAVITRDLKEIASADALVLPGVGAFSLCMENLNKYNLVQPIKDFIGSGKPFLGICLGLQLLFEKSIEFGSCDGLGIIKGKVVKFEAAGLKVPHMGWNDLKQEKKSDIFNGIEADASFYFVHSFYVVPDEEVTLTTTDYGEGFVSSIEKDNIVATQFHPEKSQSAGLKLLDNFAKRIG